MVGVDTVAGGIGEVADGNAGGDVDDVGVVRSGFVVVSTGAPSFWGSLMSPIPRKKLSNMEKEGKGVKN